MYDEGTSNGGETADACLDESNDDYYDARIPKESDFLYYYSTVPGLS